MRHSRPATRRAVVPTLRGSRTIIAMLAGAAAVIALAACGSDSTTFPRTLKSITVTPNPVTLAPGATQQFTATGKDDGGSVVAFDPTWSVTDGSGTIDQNGLYTAGSSAGTFNNSVKASNGNVSGSSTVTISAGAPSVVGDYTLLTIDGKAPPDTVVNTSSSTVEFLDGRLSLNQDATYRLLFHIRTTTSSGSVSDSTGSTGSYTVADTGLVLHNSGNNSDHLVTVTLPTLSFTDNGFLFAFTKSTP